MSAEAKIGLVNLDALFKEIPIYRESQAKIKKEFDPRARKLKNLENEWNSLNEKYLKNEKIMANDEKKELVQKGDELICIESQLAYPIKNGIPIMLPEKARKLNAKEQVD
mgnify:CR=1 FL=1